MVVLVLIYTQTIRVKCSREPWKVRSVTLAYAKIDGKVVYRPCGGCEFANGLPACRECMDSIDRVILRDLAEPVNFTGDIFVQES